MEQTYTYDTCIIDESNISRLTSILNKRASNGWRCVTVFPKYIGPTPVGAICVFERSRQAATKSGTTITIGESSTVGESGTIACMK